MNVDDKQKLHPEDESFPYYLEVGDNHDPEDGVCYFPRNGWACLWRHEPEKPTCDANPYPERYIQEQTFSMEDYPLDDSGSLIAADGILYPHEIRNTNGWDNGPSGLWDFIETVRDEYYENGVNPETLPVRVITHRSPDTYPESPHEEVCEVYFRNGANDLEYIMWNSNELYGESGKPNSELIQKILTAVGNAYETPAQFLQSWGFHQVQIEADSMDW